MKKRQKLNFKIDPLIPESLIGDEKRLAQVISNLLTNAVKFSPEYGEIHLLAHKLNEDNGIITLLIEVADNGIGISKNKQESIFNIFGQVDSSSSRELGGVGLGLPISKRIVEEMKGKIWVDSDLGKGSKFTFTCEIKIDM